MIKKLLSTTVLAAAMVIGVSTASNAIEVGEDYVVENKYIALSGKTGNGNTERFYIDPETFQVIQVVGEAPFDPIERTNGSIPEWFEMHGIDISSFYTDNPRVDVPEATIYLDHDGNVIYNGF